MVFSFRMKLEIVRQVLILSGLWGMGDGVDTRGLLMSALGRGGCGSSPNLMKKLLDDSQVYGL